MDDVAGSDIPTLPQTAPPSGAPTNAATGEPPAPAVEIDPITRLLGHLMRGEIIAASALGAELAEAAIEPAGEILKFIARLQDGEARIADLQPQAGSAASMPSRRLGSIAIAPAAGARKLVLSFGGNTPQFALPLPLVCLADTHVILIRDPMRSFSLTGVKRLGETYEMCLANLRSLIATLGASEIYCLGISAGGYSAMKYGLDLGALGVVAFSPPTTLNLEDDPGATLAKYPQLTRLYRVARPLGQDMVRLYREAPAHPGTVIIFTRNQKRDSWLARRMRGVPGVRLEIADPEARHTTFQYYCQTRKIDVLLGQLFSLTPQVRPPKPLPVVRTAARKTQVAEAPTPATNYATRFPGLRIVSSLGRYMGLRKAARGQPAAGITRASRPNRS